jgi:hypothetical protein
MSVLQCLTLFALVIHVRSGAFPGTGPLLAVNSNGTALVLNNAELIVKNVALSEEVKKLRTELDELKVLVNDIKRGAQLDSGAIVARHLGAGQVTSEKIADDAVITTKIAAGAVNEADLATGAVSNRALATDSVSELKIQSSAVSNAKLATDAVTTTKIQAGGVQESDLASSAVSTRTIQTNAVQFDRIHPSVLPAKWTVTQIPTSAWTKKLNVAVTGTAELAFYHVAGRVYFYKLEISLNPVNVSAGFEVRTDQAQLLALPTTSTSVPFNEWHASRGIGCRDASPYDYADITMVTSGTNEIVILCSDPVIAANDSPWRFYWYAEDPTPSATK